jgi:DNA-binding GntR family transcriptional regulator
MPVLEAIRRLERDGLVTQIPKWGAFVKQWSPVERLEAVHIRRALEGEAARLFVLRASEEAKRELVRLGQRFDELALTDPIACDEVDVAIHRHIAWSTGFERLAQLIDTSKVETATIFGNFWDEKLPDYRSKVGIHGPLIQALLGSDPDAAMRLMWEHIDQFVQVLLGQAADSGPAEENGRGPS